MKSLAAIILTIIAGSAASAADWLFVDATEKGNRFYIDTESISEEDGFKLAWIKVEIVAAETDADKFVQLWKLDCTSKRFAVPAYTVYAKNGDVLEDDDTPYASWSNIRPETVSENIFDLICTGDWRALASAYDSDDGALVEQALRDAASAAEEYAAKSAEEAAADAASYQVGDYAAEAGEAEESLDDAAKSALEAANDAARYQDGSFAAEAGDAKRQPNVEPRN